jgi:hypothetical protein
VRQSHANTDDLYLGHRITGVSLRRVVEHRDGLAALLVAVAGAVFVASVLPLPSTGGEVALAGPFGLGADKWVHAASYAAIAGLAVWGRRARGAADGVAVLVGVVLVVAAFGASIEAVQLFVPGRTASGGDVLANAVGAVVGVVAALWIPLPGR